MHMIHIVEKGKYFDWNLGELHILESLTDPVGCRHWLKIYRYRRNLIVPGFGQRAAETTKFRKSRNIVTFSYNITIWSVEAVSTFIVIFLFIPLV